MIPNPCLSSIIGGGDHSRLLTSGCVALKVVHEGTISGREQTQWQWQQWWSCWSYWWLCSLRDDGGKKMMVLTISTISKQGNSWVQTKVEDLASQLGGKHEERGRFGPFRQNTLSLQRYIAGKRAKQTQLPPSFENKETLPQARMFKFHLQPYVEVSTTILSTYVFSVLLWKK